jgi:hypothetical protein|tara:strand:- start:127 stop:261 length:135 start_codon:yes stop_codon:yes gene_type:complete
VQKFFILKATLFTSASSASSVKVAYIWVLLLDALPAGVMGKALK